MALTYYDPLSDLYFGLPSLRNQWGFSPSWAHWEESLVPRALTVPVHEVVSDKDKFQVTLPLGDFKSNEINVKLVDRSLVISAEHEEKPDEHGHIHRRITRNYPLPGNVDCDKLNATFSDNGTLVVSAQKKAIEAGKERIIEIEKVTSKTQPQQETLFHHHHYHHYHTREGKQPSREAANREAAKQVEQETGKWKVIKTSPIEKLESKSS